VTVGTQLTFNRLIKAVENWALENQYHDIIFQTGNNAYQPKIGVVHDFINAQQMDEYFDLADIVIAHAGMGSVLTSLTKNKPLVIMPRLLKYNEHRNDHQVATYKKVKNISGIYACIDEFSVSEQINLAIKSKKLESSISPYASAKLTDYIRSQVLM
jgi:UDP-N-acetylglucosamine transferase subunit ALG13